MTRRALAPLVALLLAVPALADARPGGGGDRGGDRAPSAQLQASGTGAMNIAGRLAVAGVIPGRGTVIVVDRAGDAEARLAGEPLRFSRRRAAVRGASGMLVVTGSRVTIRIAGRGLSFSIAGHGKARLSGTGVYRLNGGPEREWPRGSITLARSKAKR